MLHSINNLRAVAQACRSGQPLPDPLAAWLAESLQSYLDQRSGTLNDAFGLRNGRGGVPWRVEEGIRKRDAALRALCRRHLSGLKPSAQARAIHQMSLRYAASCWRFDSTRETPPDHYCGTPKEFLWPAFKSGAAMPLSPRQLRNVLSVPERRPLREAAPAIPESAAGTSDRGARHSARVWTSPCACSVARGGASDRADRSTIRSTL